MRSDQPHKECILIIFFSPPFFHVFQQVKRDSVNSEYTAIEANKQENRRWNRYRDVYPYDHSRVVLWDCEDTDYINASLVQVRTN